MGKEGYHHASASGQALRVVCAGGGTGGHVFPAVAIADALKKRRPEATITFAGARGRIEWNAVPRAGYEIRPIWISGLQRRFTFSNILVPLKLLVSLFQSLRLLRRLRPHAVVCTGGYVSGPVGWVAAKMGIPLFLQEQNSFPGVTTRLLSGHARRVFTAFEPAAEHLPKPASAGRIRLLGNPARAALLPLYDEAQKQRLREKARHHFGIPAEASVLLILGGSG
ncbi:MAG: UDP-N-acetylglucosamine--N-acetylmuramyl-(pentapeptide) pyrophosphoryl-undecaprenol N-acetylglucosamine transferase, partial [Cyclonatronaceae bacterium]